MLKPSYGASTIHSEYTGSAWIIKVTAHSGFELYNVHSELDDGYGGSTSVEFDINEARTEATATIWAGENDYIPILGYLVQYPVLNPEHTPVDLDYLFNITGGSSHGYWDMSVTAQPGFKIVEISSERDDGFGGSEWYYWEVAEDGLTATFSTETTKDPVWGGIWSVNVEPTGGNETVGGEYGSIYVYSITMDDLEQFARIRFYHGDQHPVTDPEVWDLGLFVNKIIRLHIDVPVNDDPVQLICADFNTEIVVKTPAVSVVSLDFGSVEIPAYNGDAVDMQSMIEVFVPFVGLVSLSSDYIGLEIQMICDVDVVTGDGVIKLLHDGVPFQFNAVQPFTDIIYRLVNKNNTNIGEYPFSSFVLYGLEPYVLVKWFESSNPDGINSSVKRGVIGSFAGFNSFQYLSGLNDEQMLTSEQELIMTALERGVYIE